MGKKANNVNLTKEMVYEEFRPEIDTIATIYFNLHLIEWERKTISEKIIFLEEEGIISQKIIRKIDSIWKNNKRNFQLKNYKREIYILKEEIEKTVIMCRKKKP